MPAGAASRPGLAAQRVTRHHLGAWVMMPNAAKNRSAVSMARGDAGQEDDVPHLTVFVARENGVGG